MPVQMIRNRRVYEQVADQLRDLIEKGVFPRGSFLPSERLLTRRLGINRTSLREALVVLEVLGLVEIHARYGTKVVGPESRIGKAKPKETDDGSRCLAWISDSELNLGPPDFDAEIPPQALLQARRLVEPEAAALAAKNASEEQLAGIRTALPCKIEDERAVPASTSDSRLLHVRIAEASGNTVFALMIRYLLGQQHRATFQRSQELCRQSDISLRFEHELGVLVVAICARDARMARQAMSAHLDWVISLFSPELGCPADKLDPPRTALP